MGRPKGSKNKKKMAKALALLSKKVDPKRFLTCNICGIYQAIPSNKRTTVEDGKRKVHTRLCPVRKADVMGGFDACEDIKIAKTIYCQHDFGRVYVEVCVYKFNHKIDDCGKCDIGWILSEIIGKEKK